MSNFDAAKKDKLLLLLKFDVEHLYERACLGFDEYIKIFAQKRTRNHFQEVFKNRYWGVSVQELSLFSIKLISALDTFYTSISKIYWYLQYTEDMPATVEGNLIPIIKDLKKMYQNIQEAFESEDEGGRPQEELTILPDLP